MDLDQQLVALKLTPLNGAAFEPVTEDQLCDIERLLGKPLPTGYRHFLSTYGASDFEEYAVFPTEGGGVAPGSFFGANLEKAIEEYRDRLPQGMIAINDDGAENVVCVSLRDDSYGAIFYQSHSVGAGEPAGNQDMALLRTMVPLAPDFDAFINSLRIE